MPKTKSLSAFWREDASSDRVMELASILQGANSLLGVMGTEVAATWSTTNQAATYWTRVKQGGRILDTRVFLDYSPLASIPAPFDARRVDEVIGYAVHEGGHCIWTSPDCAQSIPAKLAKSKDLKIRDYAANAQLNDLNDPISKMILRVDNIVEDAFIDFNVASKWPVLGEYIHIARSAIAARRPIDYTKIAESQNPPYGHMVNLWLSVALYNYPMPAGASPAVAAAMEFLIADTIMAIKAWDDPARRFVISFECWEYLFTHFTDMNVALPKQAPQPPKPPTPPAPSLMPTPEAKKEPEEDDADEPSKPETKGEGEKPETEGEEPKETDEKPDAPETKDEGDDEDDAQADADAHGDDDDDDAESNAGGESGGSGKIGDGVPEEGGDGKGTEATPENPPDVPPMILPGEMLGHLQGGNEEDDEGQEKNGETSSQGGDQAGTIGDLDDFDNRENKPIPDYLADEVLNAIAHDIEDLSKSVAEVLDVDPKQVAANTKKADYDADAARKVTATVEPEIAAIRRVFDRQAAVKNRTLTGKVSGRLDGRKVYRIFTGNPRIFKRRVILEKLDMGVCLLADASGSMRWRMDTVYQTCAVFAEALIRKQGVNFLALTYTGGMYNCQTTRICDRSMPHLCLKNVAIGGGTPTATALASAKVLMDRMREGQKVIIHFTDGDPDDSYAVQTVIKKLRAAGYTVWGIAPEGYEATMRSQYGEGNFETIAQISDLPLKVAELVKRLTA